jgi:hypothetical protein
VLLVAALTMGTVVFAAAPGGAGQCAPNADGRVKVTGGPTFGIGVLNQTGADQSVGRVSSPGEIVNFLVRYRNDTGNARGITVGPEVQSQPGQFRVRFYVGATNVTDQLFGQGQMKFTGVAPGASTPQVRIEVKFRASTPSNSLIGVSMEGKYGDSFVCGDKVKTFAGNL